MLNVCCPDKFNISLSWILVTVVIISKDYMGEARREPLCGPWLAENAS